MPTRNSATHFKGRYRIASIRLPGRDYSAAGYYFVTICTARRRPFFGLIRRGEMVLSAIGECAWAEWFRTAELRPEVALDEFVVMPDHVHLIIALQPAADAPHPVVNQFGPLLPGSLQAVMNGYKGAVTRWGRNHGQPHFGWQPRYWEHIIRNSAALRRIRAYIANNPARWAREHASPDGLWR